MIHTLLFLLRTPMSDLWIPISILISLTLLLGSNIYFSSRNKKEIQITIRQILDRGGELSPELLNTLGSFKSAKVLDLRRSLVLISVGIACLIAGTILDQNRLSMAIAVFPLLIGLALLISWKINRQED